MGRASVRSRRVLAGLRVSQESASMEILGSTQQFTAHGTYSDGSEEDVTAQVSWSSSAPTNVRISNEPGSKGLATAVWAGGAAQIKAGLSYMTDTTVVFVGNMLLVEIEVTPGSPSIAVGSTQQFTATGVSVQFQGTEHRRDFTALVSWSSSAPTVVEISNEPGSEGLATAVGAGTAEIGAAFAPVWSGPVGTTSVLVTEAAVLLVAIVVAPESPSIGVGSTQQFTAHGTYSDGSEEDVTAQVSWSSSAPTVIQMSNEPGSKGLATAVGAGAAEIGAAGATEIGAALAGMEIRAALAGMVGTTPVLLTA